MTLPTIEQLEAMLANVPPKPWTVAFRSDGSAYCSFGDPMAGAHLQINIGLDWDGRFGKHIAALIALAPTLVVQRIADAKRIAELEAALTEARRAIGDHYAPSECYATGPLTGDSYRDLVQCPACTVNELHDAIIEATP